MSNPARFGRGRIGDVSVSLVLVILAACLAAASAYVFYVRMDFYVGEAQKAKAEAALLKKELDSVVTSIQDWKRLVGEDELAQVQQVVEESGLTAPRNNLKGMLDDYRDVGTLLQQQLEVAQRGMARPMEDLKGIQAQFDRNQQIRQEELTQARADLTSARSELARIKKELGDEISQLRREKRKITDKLVKSEEDWGEQERDLNMAVEALRITLRQSVEEVRAAQIDETWDIDALVLHVDSAVGSVGIDKGSRDGMKTGMHFEVLRVDERGAFRRKGRVRIRTTRDEISFADVVEAVEGAPVIAGDMLRSPLFPPGERFVVLGFFPRKLGYQYTFEEIQEQLIRRFGGEVSREVTVLTDYVVVGEVRMYDDEFPHKAWLGKDFYEFMDEDLPKIEHLLGRQLGRFGEDRLQDIADGDTNGLSAAKELRIEQLRLDDLLQYVSK